MRLRRISALVLTAAVATTMLTGCPWDKEEEPGSSSSSSSSSSSRPSYDDDDEDDGRPDKPNRPDKPDKPEEPEEPEEPEIPEGGYEIDEATGAYTVYTEEGLRAWEEANNDSSSGISCTLAMDIALSGGWEPTGGNAGYSAVFDGQGHTISGLDQAFFTIIDGGTVRNLHLKVDIASTEGYTGGVAETSRGTIENCTVSGRIQGNGTSTGGIAGMNAAGGSIRGCTVSADVKGGMASGGIAGLTERETKITACCFADGSVEGEVIGGIAGAVTGGTVTSCYWSGSPEQAAGGSQGETVNSEKVDGTTVTWETAVDAMNAQLTGCEYEFVLGSDGKPELVQKGSAEQAAAQLLKHFKK